MKDEFRVLYEDNAIVVVEKPQNIPSQEDSSGDRDMLTMVKDYVKEKYNKPGNVFIGLVHRLDRPTGGVMVFARNSKSASRLSEQFNLHTAEKTYFAVLCGCPRDKKGKLTHYLKKDASTNTVVVVPALSEGAKKAELEYEVLETVDGYSLVKVHLLTGRSHQIRVQFKTIGTPIYGDAKYGKEQSPKGLLNLYAVELVLEHPTQKDRMRFICYPPEEELMWKKFNIEKYLLIK